MGEASIMWWCLHILGAIKQLETLTQEEMCFTQRDFQTAIIPSRLFVFASILLIIGFELNLFKMITQLYLDFPLH